MEQLSPQLRMERKNLDNLPEINIPDGFILRNFIEGDEVEWNKMVVDVWAIDFDEKIRGGRFYTPERVKFICSGDKIVATAIAWRDENIESLGNVHMVGSNPEFRGRGLGFQVTLAVLHQMKAEGRTSAFLTTDDFRLPAIKTYLKLGFEPVIVHENQPERWKTIYGKLGIE